MKTVLLAMLLTASSISNLMVQETEKTIATYVGYEDSLYSFTDKDGYSIEFNHISDEAQKAYGLTDKKYVGKLFQITYVSETETDELDEDITVNSIVALKYLE